MPSQLVSSSGCCQPCDSEPVVVNIPGPQGAAGTNGTNGVDGIDSFTYTTAPFFVPALGSSVLVFVDNFEFLPESVAGQFFVSIQGVGYMQVLSVDGFQLTLQNPAAGVLGIANAIPTTLIPTGSLITLAGAIGPQGAAGVSGGAPFGGTYIVRVPDVSLPSATALNSFMPGYVKTQGSAGFGAVFTSATVPIADVTGVVPIAKGGTNLSTAPAANKILVGDGTNYVHKEIVGTAPIVVANSAGNITISAPSVSAFNYVTFTRRITSNPPTISSVASNPFSSTTYPSTTYSGIDTASGFTAANGRFTASNSGYYRLSALIHTGFTSGVYDVIFQIRKNATPIYSVGYRVSAVDDPPVMVEFLDQASVSDFYELFIASATNNSLFNTGSSFSIQRIQA